jgi:hypothetical protein
MFHVKHFQTLNQPLTVSRETLKDIHQFSTGCTYTWGVPTVASEQEKRTP